MAEGKAVVASDVGGVSELVENGVTGQLVPPQAQERLAELIVGLLRDPEKRKRMGKKEQGRIKQYFSFE